MQRPSNARRKSKGTIQQQKERLPSAGFGLLNLFHGKLAYIVIGKLISTFDDEMNCEGKKERNQSARTDGVRKLDFLVEN